ncbi:uncharacterized protein LOC132709946 [Pantherophis guttatus]|uniref:Uncharacterized protein LOC132709946 n=1 Tax=Pantherophis guttatus TaxID=94885 RepID=A0ABM3YXZ9_PANGU|nr:uncharacterized protein LOC132709946 [Pantherophis guttatus]
MDTFRMFSRTWKAQWRTLLIGLFILFSSLDAQVIQAPAKLKVQEGGSFTLKCNSSIQYQPYFWYQQLPGTPPSLILYIHSQGSQNDKGFVAKYLEKGEESHLHRRTAQLRDSGSYFCAVQDTVVKEGETSQPKPQFFCVCILCASLVHMFLCFVSNLDAQVIQTPAKLEVEEGGSFTLKCHYSIQYQPYFWPAFWSRPVSGGNQIDAKMYHSIGKLDAGCEISCEFALLYTSAFLYGLTEVQPFLQIPE